MTRIDASCAFVSDSGDVAGILIVEDRAAVRGFGARPTVRQFDAATGKLIKPDVLRLTDLGLEYRPLDGIPWQLFGPCGDPEAWEAPKSGPDQQLIYVREDLDGAYFLIHEESAERERVLHVQPIYVGHDQFYAEEPETFKYGLRRDLSIAERYPTFVVDRILRVICFLKQPT